MVSQMGQTGHYKAQTGRVPFVRLLALCFKMRLANLVSNMELYNPLLKTRVNMNCETKSDTFLMVI